MRCTTARVEDWSEVHEDAMVASFLIAGGVGVNTRPLLSIVNKTIHRCRDGWVLNGVLNKQGAMASLYGSRGGEQRRPNLGRDHSLWLVRE